MAKTRPAKTRNRRAASLIDQSKIRVAMVGFLDLLGFSSRVESIETEEDFEKVAASIVTIQRYFEHRSGDTHVREVHRIMGKRVLAFSDCVVTAVSAETSMVESQGLFDVFGSEIWDIAHSQSSCVMDGHFLRGGVDFGTWYQKRDLLVSPAMVGAYKLERDRACYPVIGISKSLYRLLRDHPGRRFYSKDWDPFPDEFRAFKHPKSGKKIRFINYLGLIASSLDWQHDRATYEAYMAAPRDSEERGRIMDQGYTASLIAYFQRHKEMVEAAHGAAPASAKDKYVFLAKYHNETVMEFLPKQRGLRIKV
jgi:hypothetical protein